MLDNLEQLQLQLAQLQGELDGHEAARQLERDRILKEFPKRDMLRDEVRRLNNNWLPYDSNRNWNIKDDLLSYLVDRAIPHPENTLAQYHKIKERICAAKVGLTYSQWQVIYSLGYLGYNSRKYWEKDFPRFCEIYTDGGLHYFSVILGRDAIAVSIESDVVYLEGRTPAARNSIVYLAILPDGLTYLVENIRYDEKKYDIGAIRYGQFKQI